MSVAIPQIEIAVAQAFSGKLLRGLSGKVVEVPVFVDYPDTEMNQDQRYPSISVMLGGLSPEPELYDTTDTSVVALVNNQVTTRRTAEWYRISYDVSTRALSAVEDRELMRWVESRFSPRDHIIVDDGQGGEVAYSIFRDAFSIGTRVDVDTVIYEKTWTFSVLADIEDLDHDMISPAVQSVRVQSSLVKTTNRTSPPNATNTAYTMYNVPVSSDRAETAEKTTHRVFEFNDQRYWFPQK
jgi:hypothetical protein